LEVTVDTPTPSSEKNPFEISLPSNLLAKDTLTDQPKPTDSAAEEAELKAVLAQARLQSMEIDMSGLDVGTAPTILRHSTPAPAMPVTPAPVVAIDEPPPALYKSIRIRLNPSMVELGTPVEVKLLGVKPNGEKGEIDDMLLSTMKCDPEDGGSFTFGVFTPSKEGKIVIHAALADGGGSIVHEDNATLTVNAAAKVEFSDSMRSVVAPAALPIAVAAAKPLTVSDTPLEQDFFHGKKPKAMTLKGSPIYPSSAPTPPEPVARPSRDVEIEIRKVSAWQVKLWNRITGINWKRVALIAIGLLFCGGLAFGATFAYLSNGHGEATAIEAPSTPSAPVATVTDASIEAEATIPVGVDLPVVHPTTRTEPGLSGTPGMRVSMSARAAFPVSCLTGWSTARTDGIHFFCAPAQRHGDDVCDCTVVGVVPR
jgi:hypothetical protein